MIETPMRPRIALEDGWEFIRQRAGRSWLEGRGGGQPTTLPHCWNAHDTFQYGRTSYSGWGAYRRLTTLPVPENGVAWALRFGGFYGVGDVWFDGRRLARVDGQYLGATVALPPFRESSDHVLAVRLDNRWRRNVLPGFKQPDFILHGGLAGGAWLEGLPELRLDVESVHIDCTPLDSGAELVRIDWALDGSAAGAGEAVVEWRVTDAGGNAVASAPAERASRDAENLSTALEVPAPRCWSPAHPSLYWAEGRLLVDDTAVDVVRVRFGVTRAEFRPRRGFYLNGVRVDLHGCNRHQSIPGFGSALPDSLERRDADILKRIGCNFVRLSHYPQSPVFLDACDELGILVYAEIATWKSVRSARGWRKAARRQMRDLIVRDRHHPSVILWGMGNESRSRSAYLELREIARELDPKRPVTYAENHLHRARRERTLGIPDVWSVNYELDVLDEACASSRLENVLLSECCNHPESVRGDDWNELTQVATVEQEWEAIADRPDVPGHAVWSFTDYATEHRNRYRRLAGLFDAWRRPKMAAELFRARFAAEPFVALFVTTPGPRTEPSRFRLEHRSDGEGRAPLELHAFTNCETLRLARDGSMLAVLEGAVHHVLPLFGHFDEIIATGSQDGLVVQDRVKKNGEAHRIHLRTAPSSPMPTLEVEVEIHDPSSAIANDWNGAVHLAVDGPGRCHAYNEASEVVVVRGVGRAYVTVDPGHDGVVVTASAPGLSPAILSLHDD